MSLELSAQSVRLVDNGLHGDEIDDSLKALLPAQRDLNRNWIGAQFAADGIQ